MSEQTSWVGREEAAQPHTPYVVARRTRGEGLGKGGAHGERGGGAPSHDQKVLKGAARAKKVGGAPSHDQKV